MQKRLGDVRILVVEDDFLISLELEAILLESGAQIAGLAGSVNEALPLIGRKEIDVALLDIRLYDETVAPVARELARRDIPFVFYSGQIESDVVRSEFSDHPVVAKPALPSTIVTAIADCLANHRGAPPFPLLSVVREAAE